MAYESFREKERAGWGAKADIYGDYTARITTQAIPTLLAKVRTRVGLDLLDICTGPGYAAGAATAIGARARGVDFAPEMVAAARRNFPACEFFEGDAQSLDLDDAACDAAVCPFGVFHLTDPPRAFAEARRILRPGGRYAFSQWCAPEESDLFRMVNGAIARHADMSRVEPAPDAFVYSDRDRSREAIGTAGFEDIEITEVSSIYHAPEGDFFDNVVRFSVRTPLVLETQDPKVVATIRNDVNEAAKDYISNGRQVVPVPSFVVSGMVPG